MTAAAHATAIPAILVSVERSPGGGNGHTITVDGVRTWIVANSTATAIEEAMRSAAFSGVGPAERQRFVELATRELAVRTRVELTLEVG